MLNREEFIELHAGRLADKQILIYNSSADSIAILKKMSKKVKATIEETGVNIAYIAFGFVNWTESEDSDIRLRAPLLLAPITLGCDSPFDPCTMEVRDDELIVNPTFSSRLALDTARCSRNTMTRRSRSTSPRWMS